MAKGMRALTELRQACCHPQIVRRQDALLGQQRLSMGQILARLTTQAFSHYDNTLRAWLLMRIVHIAAQAHFAKNIGKPQAYSGVRCECTANYFVMQHTFISTRRRPFAIF